MPKGIKGFQKGHKTWNKGLEFTTTGSFKKGRIPWNKNLTKEIDKRVLNYSQKVSETLKGHKGFWKGKSCSEETKEKMSKTKKGMYAGKNNPNWQGGISFEPYSVEWTKELKKKVKERDNYICQLCDKTKKEQNETDSLKRGLTVHHINYDKKNCAMNNLITLCRKCNSIVNFKREDWINYFKQKLI